MKMTLNIELLLLISTLFLSFISGVSAQADCTTTNNQSYIPAAIGSSPPPGYRLGSWCPTCPPNQACPMYCLVAYVPINPVTELTANLTGETGFPGTGLIRYRADNNGGNLHADIQLPVDGNTIADSNTAASSVYTLSINVFNLLTKKTITLTSCSLKITQIKFSDNGHNTTATELADYQVKVYENADTMSALIGSCTTLPSLSPGDTVSVTLQGGNKTPILTGTLASSCR